MFEICADAPALAGPESASNTVTRISDFFLLSVVVTGIRGGDPEQVGYRLSFRCSGDILQLFSC